MYVASGTLNTAREFWWDELERLLLLPGRMPAVLRLSVDGGQINSTTSDAATYSEDQWQELPDGTSRAPMILRRVMPCTAGFAAD